MLPRGIQKALFDMALPYGFALAIWGSGTILTRSRGTPHVGDIFLGALGVVVAYGARQFLGRRADEPADEQLGSADRPILGGAGHVLAIAGALGAAALLAHARGVTRNVVGLQDHSCSAWVLLNSSGSTGLGL